MRLLRLEMKRVLKSRMTYILLFIALMLTFVMAWMPTTFSYSSYTDENGNTVELTGLEAIRFEKQQQAELSGVVTTEKVRQAVERYQACLTSYGVEESYDLPEGVYDAEIAPYAPLLRGVKEVFADPDTGIAPSVMEIDPEEIDDYYELCEERIVSLMELEQEGHPAAQEAAAAMYDKVEKPYLFFPGYSTDAMDYQLLLAFFVLLFCAAIAAPVFSSDYQTGADDILRCTKYGKVKIAGTKIASAVLICGTAYAICTVIYVLVSNSLFGWECTKTSMQMLYSIVNLLNMDLLRLQCFAACTVLLCILATVSFTLFLSSKCKSTAASLTIALICCILPVILYMALPSEISDWICSILPASGAALQTSILYALIDFRFLNIGKIAVWIPKVMIGAYIVEIPLFVYLTIRSYIKHE